MECNVMNCKKFVEDNKDGLRSALVQVLEGFIRSDFCFTEDLLTDYLADTQDYQEFDWTMLTHEEWEALRNETERFIINSLAKLTYND